jgi:hypothetical protein
MPPHRPRINPGLASALLGLFFFACASGSGSEDTSPGTSTGGTTIPATGGRGGAGGGAQTSTATGGSVGSGGIRTDAAGGSSVAAGGSSVAAGGISSGGMTSAAGGAISATGGKQTGGSPSSTGGTTSASGGNNATGGITASGGTRTGGTTTNPGTGGSTTNPGTGGSTTNPGTGGATGLVPYPFGCKFAWGAADDKIGSPSSATYLQFASTWVDSTISAAGKYTTCNACTWLTNSIKSTNLIPAYYAYIIGFLAHANGIVDGNQTGSKKLTTDGAALVKANRQAIVDAYAWYAKETYKVWPSKPLVWLLEGDFVQLVDSGQSSPLSYAELSSLVVDITRAIKSGMPNGVVAIDHSSWNADDVSKKYWDAMKAANYDLVWTTGVGNNGGFINADGNASAYNGATAKYSWLKSYTGKPIIVDTSAGASAAGDTWSVLSVADLNARISEGAIAANITGSSPSSANISKLSGVNPLPGCQ